MIEIKNLIFKYAKNKVINNFNLNINKNEKVTIIGKSGCGKTTLLYLLAHIYKPNSGVIKINDIELNEIRPTTGIIFQNGGLFPWKNVFNNLSLGLKARGVPNTEINNKVLTCLAELDIIHLKDKFINQLSGGERQRVSIGRALVLESDLLLLDEPSSSLDAITKEQFQNTLLKLYSNHDITSILVTHDIEEAVFLGQKIIIMKDGKIEEMVDNDLYGKKDIKDSIKFYEQCIRLRKKLDIK